MTSLATGSLAELALTLTGDLHLPGSADYDRLALPWNVAAASAPVAVVEVADALDVSSVVRFAAARGLRVAVQATGHGASPFGAGTILVHTNRLQELEIRPQGSARAGAGVTWAQVLDAAAPFGLAGLAGSAPNVGVVGYHTGGGLSPIGRGYGYASDHVLAFDVVTGDGEFRRATATENPALFWGLRGGKGTLGIVTAIEFALFALPEILGGTLYFDGADAGAVGAAWREWTADLPEQASTSLAILRLPPMPGVPEPLAGRTTVAVRFAWTGDVEQGYSVFGRLRAGASAVLGGIGVMPVTALASIHADPVDPMPVHEASTLLRELPAEAVEALLDVAGPASSSPQLIVELRLLGGATGRPPRHPSAMGHRDAAFSLLTIGLAAPPVRALTARDADAILARLAPWSDGAALPNFAPTTDPARIRGRYCAPTLDRLASLARTYDPAGVIAAADVVRAASAPDQA